MAMLFQSTQTLTDCPLLLEKKTQARKSPIATCSSTPAKMMMVKNDSHVKEEEDAIPTIVLTPELAIQPLDFMFSQFTAATATATTTNLQQHDDQSCCPRKNNDNDDDIPFLKATSIDSCISSHTVLFASRDERGGGGRRRRAAFLSATVIKESQDVALGMGLRKNKKGKNSCCCGGGSTLQISSIRPDCLLSDSPFQVGDKLISINNVDCSNKSLSSVAKILKTTTGLLTVVVENTDGDPQLVESMIIKATPTSKTGLGVTRGTTSNQIKVSSIDSKGIFALSLLNRRDVILSINGTPCDYLRDAKEAAKIVVTSQRTVTILAERQSDNGAVVFAAAAVAA